MFVTSPRLVRRTAVVGWFVFTIGIVPGHTWAFWERTRPAYRNVARTTEPSLSGQFRTIRAAIRVAPCLMARPAQPEAAAGRPRHRRPGVAGRSGRSR